MSMLIAICFYLIMLLIPLTIYRRWYPRAVSAVHVTSDGSCNVIPVKPSKRFFRSYSLGKPYSFVSLGSGIVALYSSQDDSFLPYSSVFLSSDVFLFRSTRLGRLRSVDLSDRCLIDILKKFEVKK